MVSKAFFCSAAQLPCAYEQEELSKAHFAVVCGFHQNLVGSHHNIFGNSMRV